MNEQNIELDLAKMPKGVRLVLCGLSLFAIGLFVYGLIPYPYPSQPWTNQAVNLVLSAGLMYYIRMISKRNLFGVAMVSAALFVSLWISISFAAANILAILPWAFLLWPSNLRWLKANSRFSVFRLVGLGVMILACGVLCITPSFSENDISNMNPIRLFVPGEAAIHALDESRQHNYVCWEHGGRSGMCRVKYDENGKCCSAYWEKSALSSKTGDDYEAFVASAKDECEKRFGNIKWFETVTDEGRIVVLGQVDDGLAIKISPHGNMFVLGSVMIYSPRICHEPSQHEIDMFDEMGRQIQSLWDESYAAVERGASPEEVAKAYCRDMRLINPEGRCDELAAATFFRTRCVYGKQYHEVACEFCTVWETNARILFDKTSNDYIFRGELGCHERIATMKEALDKWALELDSYYKRMEGAGRIFCAGEIEVAFESYQKGLLAARQSHLDILMLFRRQHEILQIFACDGRENPMVSNLIDEFSANQDKIKFMAKGLMSNTGTNAENFDSDNRLLRSANEKSPADGL